MYYTLCIALHYWQVFSMETKKENWHTKSEQDAKMEL